MNVIFRQALYGVDQSVSRNKGQGINRRLVTAAAWTLRRAHVSFWVENVAQRSVYLLTFPVSPASFHFITGLY